MRGRKHYEPDELALTFGRRRRTALAAIGAERHPEAQALHLAGQGHPPRMGLGHLIPGPCPPIEIAQHLRISIELDLQVEMPVGQWDQQQAGCPQNRLRHTTTITDRLPQRDPFSAHVSYRRWPRGQLLNLISGDAAGTIPITPGAVDTD